MLDKRARQGTMLGMDAQESSAGKGARQGQVFCKGKYSIGQNARQRRVHKESSSGEAGKGKFDGKLTGESPRQGETEQPVRTGVAVIDDRGPYVEAQNDKGKGNMTV